MAPTVISPAVAVTDTASAPVTKVATTPPVVVLSYTVSTSTRCNHIRRCNRSAKDPL